MSGDNDPSVQLTQETQDAQAFQVHMGRGREGSGFTGGSLTVHKSTAELYTSRWLEWLRAGRGKHMSGLQQDLSWEGRCPGKERW